MEKLAASEGLRIISEEEYQEFLKWKKQTSLLQLLKKGIDLLIRIKFIEANLKKCRFGDSRYMKIKDTLFTTVIGDITKADAWMGI